MSFSSFTPGDRYLREAPYELLALPAESPLPPWPDSFYRDVILLYAHPDDETIFAGGLMLKYPHWNWNLICAVDAGVSRMVEHEYALDSYRAAGVNIVEAGDLGRADRYETPDPRDWLDAVRRATSHIAPDAVFTHGFRGEYGHHHHIWLNQIASVLYENVWDFFNPCWRVKQLAKTHVREVPTDSRKRAIFESAYATSAPGLYANASWLMEQQMTGRPEYFTQGAVGV